MSNDKKQTSADAARRIWLASVGAYGRGFAEAQEALKEITEKSSEVFEELVAKGQKLEKTVETKGRDMMGKAVMSDLNIEDKIKKMRARLSGDADEDSSDAGGGNRQLEARMDVIEGKLDQVLELLTAKAPSNGIPVKKKIPSRRKAPARKPAPPRS